MDTIARRLELQYPATNTAVRASVQNLIRMLGDGQLAHAAGREGEMAVRTALGASRARLVRRVCSR